MTVWLAGGRRRSRSCLATRAARGRSRGFRRNPEFGTLDGRFDKGSEGGALAAWDGEMDTEVEQGHLADADVGLIARTVAIPGVF